MVLTRPDAHQAYGHSPSHISIPGINSHISVFQTLALIYRRVSKNRYMTLEKR